VLYASLLPLWEGFDEPFHYAYVLTLEKQHSLPQLGKTELPAEVWASLHLAPASHVVQFNLPWVVSFSDYFRLPVAERIRLRERLEHLPDRESVAGGLNYEAHQAPLAYLVMAAVARMCQFASFMTRVWFLRIFCGMVGAVGTAIFLLRLAERIGLPQAYQGALVFVVLSSQMFYATTAHIANDWLAVPLMIVLFERLLAFEQNCSLKNLLVLIAAMGAGLLTKGYFLALVPFVGVAIATLTLRRRLHWSGVICFVVSIAVLCGPWYLRNLRLYGNLSGMQETAGGTDWHGLAAAFGRLPWLLSVKNLAFASIWTGNNSFTSFSFVAVSALLAGYVAAASLWIWDGIQRRRLANGDLLLLCGVAGYGAALVYSTTVSFWFSKDAAISASPWYTQPILPLMLLILFLGLSRGGKVAAMVALWLTWWSAYILSATYWAKLIPLYGGYPDEGKMVLLKLLQWYGHWNTIAETLSLSAVGGPYLILGLAATVVFASFGLAVIISRSFAAHPSTRMSWPRN